MTDVSVIIPTHNRRELLRRTLSSVLAQQDVDLEVVIVDDGGQDGTPDSVAALADERIRFVRHDTPRGVSAARNSGLRVAQSPWVAFVDDDDLWSPVKLRRQLDALGRAPSAIWSCTGSVVVDHRIRIGRTDFALPDGDLATLLLQRNRVPGGGSGVVAARAAAIEVGAFDEVLSNIADWDFYIRLALHGPAANVPETHVGYFVHPTGMAHNVERSAQEYGYLRVKYERQRQARGVELDEVDWNGYLADLARNGGNLRLSRRLEWDRLTRLRHRPAARPVLTSFAPPALRRFRQRLRAPLVPPGPGELAWLVPYAEQAARTQPAT